MWDLARAVGLSEGRLSLEEQSWLPSCYLAAWSLLRWEQSEALTFRMKERQRQG